MRQKQREQAITGITNMVGKVTGALAQRKAREQQKVFDNFTSFAKGAQDSQGQMQEAMAALKKNPQDKEAYQRYLQAKQAYDQNMTNLNDLVSGKNEKNAKLLAKGFGIDDKNAGTPERQAAIAAIKKTMPGVQGNAANLMSRMPQTQQLTPQAEGQAAGVKAGITPKAPTQGQILKAVTDRLNSAKKAGIDEQKVTLQAYKMGLIPDGTDEQGNSKFRPMTQSEKGEYQMAQKGVLAWTMQDGKPVAALRNPATNQIIPGTENPDILPPAYLTERLHEGEFTFTDGHGNVFRVPTKSETKPVLPGASSTPKGSSSVPTKPSAASTPLPPSSPKGPGRFIGASQSPGDLGKALTEHLMAPSELPGFGKSRQQALEAAMKMDPKYDPGMADIWFQQAKNPQVYLPLKYINSLTGRDNKSGNFGIIIDLSDKLKRTDWPAVNSVEMAALRQSGDKQVAAYAAAVTEVADQIAKILQGGGSGGGTSDAKLHQAQDILSASFNKDQLKEVSTTLRGLLANRKEELVGENPWLQKEYSPEKAGKKAEVIEVTAEDMK